MKKSFTRYIIASSVTALIDFIIFISLIEVFKIYYLHSAIIAFIVGNSINYMVSKYWCFNGTEISLTNGYIKFIIVGINGIIITIGLLAISVELLQIRYFVARIIIYFITGTISFLLNYFFTFEMDKIKKKGKIKKRK